MSRTRMAMRLAKRGWPGMAEEIASSLSDKQVKRELELGGFGGSWRWAYATTRLLGEIRYELEVRGEAADSELIELLDEVREDLGAQCTNYIRPGAGTNQATASCEVAVPSQGNEHIVRVPPQGEQAGLDEDSIETTGDLSDLDALGQIACKLMQSGRDDLAASLLSAAGAVSL